MLCRLSSLFIYVVAGLVISAAATPAMGPTSDYNEEPKSRPMVPSYSKSPSHPKPYYPMDKAYARREDSPYPRPHRNEKKYSEKSHSEEKKWNDDKGKEHRPDNYKDRMSVDEKDRKDDGKGHKNYDNGRKVTHDKGRKDYEKAKDGNPYHAEDRNPSNAYCNVGEQHCCDSVNTVRHDLMVS